MKIAFIAVAIVVLVLILVVIARSRGVSSTALVKQLPAVLERLCATGTDESFVVFLFEAPARTSSDPTINLQYSIDHGVLGLDWVLIAPQNIADKEAIREFLARGGRVVNERVENGVKYLRVEGSGLEELGLGIMTEFYHLTPETRVDLVVEEFKWTPEKA